MSAREWIVLPFVLLMLIFYGMAVLVSVLITIIDPNHRFP